MSASLRLTGFRLPLENFALPDVAYHKHFAT